MGLSVLDLLSVLRQVVRRYLVALAPGLMLFASCTPKETKALLQPADALGTVLAEEAVRAGAGKKQVVIISPDANWGAVSTAEEAFRNALKKQGFAVTSKAANLGDPMRRGPIGLKAADFLDALEKSAGAGVVVSFAGPPMLSPGDAARVPPEHVPVLVVATASLGNVPGVWGDRAQLAGLLDNKIIQLAIIDSSEPGATTNNGDPAHEIFSQHYLVLERPK